MAIIAMTTSSSISVKPFWVCLEFIFHLDRSANISRNARFDPK
jgi:hypothetical protein